MFKNLNHGKNAKRIRFFPKLLMGTKVFESKVRVFVLRVDLSFKM